MQYYCSYLVYIMWCVNQLLDMQYMWEMLALGGQSYRPWFYSMQEIEAKLGI